MKKTLIALAVLGAAAGVAHAQSNVTIYGVVDTGYIKETGRDIRMGENINNRIGFRGSEDLGGGLKATFELEKRFDLFDGSAGNTNTAGYKASWGGANSGVDWDGAANVGLAGEWGRVRFGRVNELTTETIRKFDPFYQYGVGSMLLSSQRSARINNTARYDSPKWSGFSFGLSYSLGQNTKRGGAAYGVNWDNDGYAVNLSYDNGPVMLTGNWSRVADSDNSSVWNLGAAYKFGPARVSLLYERTRDKGFKLGTANTATNNIFGAHDGRQNTWLLGLEWDIGPGQLDASAQYARVRPDSVQRSSLYKYALGYTYNLSKRTSAYAQVAYTKFDDKGVGAALTGIPGRESMTGFQVGMTHKF
ncbi:MAG: porin [Betaproteobacteria bacterium]|nr:porin [Betaproteobacteria bacterium]